MTRPVSPSSTGGPMANPDSRESTNEPAGSLVAPTGAATDLERAEQIGSESEQTVVASWCPRHGLANLSCHWCPCDDVTPLYGEPEERGEYHQFIEANRPKVEALTKLFANHTIENKALDESNLYDWPESEAVVVLQLWHEFKAVVES